MNSSRSELSHIRAHVEYVPVKIETLETQGMSIVDSMSVFDETIEKLKCTPGSNGEKIRMKCDLVVRRNPDYEAMKGIVGVLSGHSGQAARRPMILAPLRWLVSNMHQ